MDYLFDALIDPTEFESEFQNNTSPYTKPFPDAYREYLFGLKYSITYIDDPKIMAEVTNTKEKYWDDKYDITEKIISMIEHYDNLPQHLLTKYLDGQEVLTETIHKYYHDIYNLVDIIIVKSSYNNNSQLLYSTIKRLLDTKQAARHIRIRLLIYLPVYYIKIKLGKHDITLFIPAVISKLEEFEADLNVWKFFIKKELDTYFYYTGKLKRKHQKMISG